MHFTWALITSGSGSYEAESTKTDKKYLAPFTKGSCYPCFFKI